MIGYSLHIDTGTLLNVKGMGMMDVSGMFNYDPKPTYTLIAEPSLPRKHLVKDLVTSQIVGSRLIDIENEIEFVTLGISDYCDFIDEIFPHLNEQDRRHIKYIQNTSIDWDGCKVKKNDGPLRNITIVYKPKMIENFWGTGISISGSIGNWGNWGNVASGQTNIPISGAPIPTYQNYIISGSPIYPKYLSGSI